MGLSFKVDDSIGDHIANGLLEETYTSDEVLEQWTLIEEKAFTTHSNPWVLSGNPRTVVVCFLRNFLGWIRKEEAWTSATTLMDSYCSKKGHTNPEEQQELTPDIAAAFAILAVKQDDKSTTKNRFADMAQIVAFLAQCPPEAVTVERIKLAECHVLRVLEWRVVVTTIQEWCISFLRRLAAFCAREDLAYRATPVLSYWSEYFTSEVAATERTPPKMLATGAFALTLIFSGLLPHHVFKPCDVSKDKWCKMPIIDSASQCVVQELASPKSQRQCSITHIAKAVGCSVQNLKKDVYAAIQALNQATPQPLVQQNAEFMQGSAAVCNPFPVNGMHNSYPISTN